MCRLVAGFGVGAGEGDDGPFSSSLGRPDASLRVPRGAGHVLNGSTGQEEGAALPGAANYLVPLLAQQDRPPEGSPGSPPTCPPSPTSPVDPPNCLSFSSSMTPKAALTSFQGSSTSAAAAHTLLSCLSLHN